jgi:transcriptional regulator with AAA-type ATPase domain
MLPSRPVPARPSAERSAEETLTDTDGRRGPATDSDVVAPHLFVVLECARPDAGVARHSLANIDRVALGRGSVRSSERAFDGNFRNLSLRIPDPRISSQHACILREGAAFSVLDLGSRNGTRVNGVRVVGPTALADGDLMQLGHAMLRYRASVTVPLGEPADVDSAKDDSPRALDTVDPSLARQGALLGRVARSTVPVLLLGETGTGKEVLARAIHRLSERKGPFVAINCGALPATLLEAQLFGHVRGAFSGAVADAPGLLRSADGGTVLLDEIGDLPGPAQAALLRALQEHEVVPVGGVRPIKIGIRIVAATHRPLEKLVACGDFRSDLFARLAGFTFRLPPLRERREDIGLLIAAFGKERAIRLKPSAARALLCHDWPLNVRELRQTLHLASALADEGAIDVQHLPPAIAASTVRSSRVMSAIAPPDALRERLIDCLARSGGNVSDVARDFGKARTQVQRWLKRYGIDARSFRKE